MKRLQDSLSWEGSGIIGWTGDGEPIPEPITVPMASLPSPAFLSHAMVAAGHFKTVGDARRAGFNAPATLGTHSAGKHRRPINIVNPPQAAKSEITND